jgi:hypothetical protein
MIKVGKTEAIQIFTTTDMIALDELNVRYSLKIISTYLDPGFPDLIPQRHAVRSGPHTPLSTLSPCPQETESSGR